jgi:hypothetical protein
MTLVVTLKTLDVSGSNQTFITEGLGTIDQLIAELTQSHKDNFMRFNTNDGFILVRVSEISWIRVIETQDKAKK